jgi:hypothetical protein
MALLERGAVAALERAAHRALERLGVEALAPEEDPALDHDRDRDDRKAYQEPQHPVLPEKCELYELSTDVHACHPFDATSSLLVVSRFMISRMTAVA